MNKITAKEARELSGPAPTVQERVDAVYPLIREAALKKERFVRLDGWWAPHPKYAGIIKHIDYYYIDYNKACELLKANGFTVSFRCDDEFQFSTVVEW